MASTRPASAQRRGLAERRAAHPDEPWLWRADWAAGRIQSEGLYGVLVAWGVALVWNAISFPLLRALPAELAAGNQAIWIALLFPLAGLALVAWAARETLRYRRFGTSSFELKTLPGVVGGRLEGAIHVRGELAADAGVTLTLSCVHRTQRRRANGKRETRERILWQETGRLARAELGIGPRGAAIPVGFTIPYDCRPSDSRNHRDKIEWRLDAHSPLAGADFAARFEVPVFRTNESSPEIDGSAAAAAARADVAAGDAGAPDGAAGERSTVRVRDAGAGARELHFPPARNPGVALGTTAFLAVWTGAIGFMLHLGAPLVFAVVFAIFDLLILAFVVSLWTASSTVRASREGLRITRRMLLFGGAREVPRDAVHAVRVEIRAQAQGRPYYDVIVEAEGGRSDGRPRRLTAGSMLRSKLEAERVAELIREALDT